MMLGDRDYDAIAAACKALLTAPDTSLARVAIPWLHVIREHPVFLANYQDMTAEEGPRFPWRRRLRETAGLAWQLASSVGLQRAWEGPQHLDQPVDVLFISHLLNAGQAGQASDFYFGAVPAQLTAAGHRSMVALINSARRPARELAGRWPAGHTVPRIVFTDSLGMIEELALRSQLQREGGALRKTAGTSLERRVAHRAAEEAATSAARRTLRLYSQVAQVVRTFGPKAIVLTHEGHAWERLAFAAARSVAAAVRCIGYQHAAIFRKQFAIRQSLLPPYNPDLILAAGPRGRAQLHASPDLRGVDIRMLGSDRSARLSARAAAQTGACLVIPEGLIDECRLLFGLSAACAREFPAASFVWRLHPSLAFESVLASSAELRDLPANIRLSTDSLEHDVASCRSALYRGSTAIVQAVIAGLTPIYLRVPGELTIDPLYDAGEWRIKVETTTELGAQLAKVAGGPEGDAQRYCEQFFSPFDAGVLASAIDSPLRTASA